MSQVHVHHDTSQQKQGMSGCAIAAIVLGVLAAVGFVVILVLIAILLPAVSRARENAQVIRSAVNMRAIMQSLEMYANDDRRNRYPDVGNWADELIAANLLIEETLQAPNMNSAERVYFFVPPPMRQPTFDSSQVLLYEHPDVFTRGGNIGYADGRVEFVNEPEFSQIISTLTLPDGTPYAPHTAISLPAR